MQACFNTMDNGGKHMAMQPRYMAPGSCAVVIPGRAGGVAFHTPAELPTGLPQAGELFRQILFFRLCFAETHWKDNKYLRRIPVLPVVHQVDSALLHSRTQLGGGHLFDMILYIAI
jgi:hypothetical protein